MKSKISFCNATVLKKDITRYLPLWLIYLIFNLLVSVIVGSQNAMETATALGAWLSYGMPIVSGIYALAVALMLFGDLTNSRLCNALHAMPLRRETWFCTHFIAGLLMAVVPNFVFVLSMLSSLSQLWYVGLVFLVAATAQYLFFFALSVFCIMVTGNRFGAALVYVLVNFLSVMLLWCVYSLIMPFLEGVYLNTAPFLAFSPMVNLVGADYYTITFEHQSNSSSIYTGYIFAFADGWSYLLVLLLVSLLLIAGALLLYRRRKLEVAGDFAAVKPVHWFVSTFGSLLWGMIFSLFAFNDETALYIMLFLGIIISFLLLEMLLQRKIRIFSKRTFLRLGILVLVLGLILGCAAIDIFNIAGYVPPANLVESVVVAKGKLSQVQLDRIDQNTASKFLQYIVITDTETIEQVLDAHQDAIEENCQNNCAYVTIHYRLKTGQTVTRNYHLSQTRSPYLTLSSLFGFPAFLYSFDSEEDFVGYTNCIEIDGNYVVEYTFQKELCELLWRDATQGRLKKDVSKDSYAVCIDYLSGLSTSYSDKVYVDSSCATYSYIQQHYDELFDYVDVAALFE